MDKADKLKDNLKLNISDLGTIRQKIDTVKEKVDTALKDIVGNLIDSLPAEKEKITSDVKEKVNKIKTFLSGFAEAEKNKISTALKEKLQKLQAVESLIAEKEAEDKAAAQKVIDAISALRSRDITVSLLKEITDVRSSYESLTVEQKQLISTEVLHELKVVETELEKETRITIQRRPVNVRAKVKKSRVTVSWKDIRSNKALLSKVRNIQIQYSTDPEFKTNSRFKMVGKNKKKVTLRLKRNTAYHIRVRFVGADGVHSNWSRTLHVHTK